MELPGSAYLFNLSLLAITFAAVSALVMLLRQTMGGKLSNFDVHLITAYVSGGFAIALGAVMPPLVWLGALSPALSWGIASLLPASFVTWYLASIVRRRRRASGPGTPPSIVLIDWSLQLMAILLLLANAFFPRLQGVILFAAALTLSLAVLMWSFVRRIATLLGDKPGEDWDPKRG